MCACVQIVAVVDVNDPVNMLVNIICNALQIVKIPSVSA